MIITVDDCREHSLSFAPLRFKTLELLWMRDTSNQKGYSFPVCLTLYFGWELQFAQQPAFPAPSVIGRKLNTIDYILVPVVFFQAGFSLLNIMDGLHLHRNCSVCRPVGSTSEHHLLRAFPPKWKRERTECTSIFHIGMLCAVMSSTPPYHWFDFFRDNLALHMEIL